MAFLASSIEEVLTPMIAFSGRSLRASSYSADISSIYASETKLWRLTQIILTDMHTLSSNSESDIDSVINQKRYFVLLGDLVKFPGSLHHDTGVIGFVPVLHHRHACAGSVE
jgi:hypothetical protein